MEHSTVMKKSKLQLYTTIWMSLLNIILSEGIQMQKDCFQIASIYTKFKNKQNKLGVAEVRRVLIFVGRVTGRGIRKTMG